MLRPWKHQAVCKGLGCRNSSSREHLYLHRQLKGLGEIEEIEEMEGSMKSMQALERFMRNHPDVWSESCVHHLLLEIANMQYTRSDEHLHTVIMRMLVPMAKTMDVEQESVKVERQKIQEATLALQRVQEECQHALADLTKEHDRSARDLEELGKALEENRMAGEEVGRKLKEKENQIQGLLQQQQDLLVRLVCGGPAEFRNWATEQIQLQGWVELHRELEHTWGSSIHKTVDVLVKGVEFNTQDREQQEQGKLCKQFVYKKASFPTMTMTLVSVMVSETVQQMVESCGRMTGPFSLPSAVAGFWLGLASRMSHLAMVALFPQLVMHKSSSSG